MPLASRQNSLHSEGQSVPAAAEPAADGSTDWSVDDAKELITFLVKRKVSAGDGGTFKKPTWIAAAAHMAQFHSKGGLKTWEACKGKWD